jgi:hypothetical protein
VENTSESFYLALRIHNVAATFICFILSFLWLLSHRGEMNETTHTLMEDFKIHLRNVSDGFFTYIASFFATQIPERAARKIGRPLYSHRIYENEWIMRTIQLDPMQICAVEIKRGLQ